MPRMFHESYLAIRPFRCADARPSYRIPNLSTLLGIPHHKAFSLPSLERETLRSPLPTEHSACAQSSLSQVPHYARLGYSLPGPRLSKSLNPNRPGRIPSHPQCSLVIDRKSVM